MSRILFFAIFVVSQALHAQVEYRSIRSQRLQAERELKIQLPRNYEINEKKVYPLILVLDGDYLFEPIAGNVDLYSYWDEIPEAVVVGVNQSGSRGKDVQYDDIRYFPHRSGADFFEFLGIELLPYLESNFRISDFIVIAGHDITANFANFFLFKPDPIFDAYINLSPDFAPEMQGRLAAALQTASSPKWFYLATGSDDVPQLKASVGLLDQKLSQIKNENFHYGYDIIQDANHYSLLGQALPRALEMIFEGYPPISSKELNQIITAEESPLGYLERKYKTIESNFDLKIPVRVNDFLAIGSALEKRKEWDALKKLGELALKQHPDLTVGTYYLARAYEENGNHDKALRTYENCYGQQEVGFMTIDFLIQRARKIEKEFGS